MPGSQSSDIQDALPGYTLDLDYVPDFMADTLLEHFPHALHPDSEIAHHNIFREILMMRVMNTITDKPEWEKKVFDEEIVSKWRTEISQSGMDVSPTMMDNIIKELQWKAGLFPKDQFVTAFDIGVVKSDSAVPADLQQALKDAVAPLEDVPEEQKDYHPGSDEKVVDLVHPSLFPLVYGRTRILPEGTIGLDDCIGSIGLGDVLRIPEEPSTATHDFGLEFQPYSTKFQWLPCDVQFEGDDAESRCRIVSYINNLHPTQHRPLYGVLERIIGCAIPLWNRTLTGSKNTSPRMQFDRVRYHEHPDPEPQWEDRENFDDDEYRRRRDVWQSTQRVILPEPKAFQPPEIDPELEINLRNAFGAARLQVIVKLANIELTPEKPEYAGGSWHIEGQMNERICATAIYYYDSANITESSLAFRQRADVEGMYEIRYEQDRHDFLQKVYGFDPDTTGRGSTLVTQDLGSVVCREGRLLTFPNILQHRVAPFALADRSKAGHRKILALFLVDPHRRVISTANVPPQREDWGREKRELVQGMLAERLPVELQQMVGEKVSDPLISMDEAKRFRLELMEERSAKSEAQNESFQTGDFSLCEH
ncbi:uncharacterized protein N7459_007162 [Penicillium hispanicum]|uniref:uncharacterized protein n=1 Tax=Penicillium hispanicum TaxID=1080232 RepID=UPI0025414394|nr:uncharacterized protein N7459_007162 [Penicillium hispanicum]KAJ5578198.1 hypothetical protein N7459_007162 [Penicillium hispanicum]